MAISVTYNSPQLRCPYGETEYSPLEPIKYYTFMNDTRQCVGSVDAKSKTNTACLQIRTWTTYARAAVAGKE